MSLCYLQLKSYLSEKSEDLSFNNLDKSSNIVQTQIIIAKKKVLKTKGK